MPLRAIAHSERWLTIFGIMMVNMPVPSASAQIAAASTMHLRACGICGLAQHVPEAPPRMRACCARCGSTLRARRSLLRSNSRTAALAIAALVLYPIAITQPMLTVTQLGNAQTTSIIDGIITLLANGEIVVGTVVLFCSVIFPLGKLASLLVMSLIGPRLGRSHRAMTYRIIDFTGRWGMLDVLALAVLVAALKLGNAMDVKPGPAALAFTVCVILSLLATATFDPNMIWDEHRQTPRRQDAETSKHQRVSASTDVPAQPA
jgi:paraquat-inducible protein A